MPPLSAQAACLVDSGAKFSVTGRCVAEVVHPAGQWADLPIKPCPPLFCQGNATYFPATGANLKDTFCFRTSAPGRLKVVLYWHDPACTSACDTGAPLLYNTQGTAATGHIACACLAGLCLLNTHMGLFHTFRISKKGSHIVLDSIQKCARPFGFEVKCFFFFHKKSTEIFFPGNSTYSWSRPRPHRAQQYTVLAWQPSGVPRHRVSLVRGSPLCMEVQGDGGSWKLLLVHCTYAVRRCKALKNVDKTGQE